MRAATPPAMKFCPMTPTLAASRPQPVSSLVRCIFPVLYMLGNCGLYPGRFKYCVVGYEALGLAETMHDAGVLLWQALAGRVQDASPNWPFVGCGLGISSSVTGCPPVSHDLVACVVSRQWSTLRRVPKVSGKLLGVRPMSGSSALSPKVQKPLRGSLFKLFPLHDLPASSPAAWGSPSQSSSQEPRALPPLLCHLLAVTAPWSGTKPQEERKKQQGSPYSVRVLPQDCVEDRERRKSGASPYCLLEPK